MTPRRIRLARRKVVSRRVAKAIAARIMTPAEVRTLMGYPPRDEA